MLRRKPTRIDIEQVDIDELDQIRKKVRAKMDTDTDMNNDMTTPSGDRALGGKTQQDRIRERLGLRNDSNDGQTRVSRLPHWSV